MNHTIAIEVKDLHKAFGETKAVDGASLQVEQGEIFSLLGPNGGDAVILGHSVRKDAMGVKSVLGVVPQEIALYEDLSARENLTFWGKMYGLRGTGLSRRVDEMLAVI